MSIRLTTESGLDSLAEMRFLLIEDKEYQHKMS